MQLHIKPGWQLQSFSTDAGKLIRLFRNKWKVCICFANFNFFTSTKLRLWRAFKFRVSRNQGLCFVPNVTFSCLCAFCLSVRNCWKSRTARLKGNNLTGFGDWPWTDNGGAWVWALWGWWSEGQPASGLSKNCRNCSAPTYQCFIPGGWTLCSANLTWPWAWNCSPAIQRHTYPGWSRPREVSYWVVYIHGVKIKWH